MRAALWQLEKRVPMSFGAGVSAALTEADLHLEVESANEDNVVTRTQITEKTLDVVPCDSVK